MNNNHRDLVEDLATFLANDDWMVWTNIPLGSVLHSSPQVADVLAGRKSFSRPVFKIYEVKASKSDFYHDTSALKYAGYFQCCHQLLFACPTGLIKADEVPTGCGLITKGDKGWHVAKAGRYNDFKLSEELLLKLLMTGYQQHGIQWHGRRRNEDIKKYTTLKQAFDDYGVKVGKDVAESQELLVKAEELRVKINQALGKDYRNLSDATWRLSSDVEQLLRQHKNTRLALQVAILANNLFNGHEFWAGGPVRELESLLDQAKKEWGNNERADKS